MQLKIKLKFLNFFKYFLLLFFLNTILYSQENNNSLEGKITNNQNEVIANAEIKIEHTHFTTKTDKNGFFKFKNIPIGFFQIIVSVEGHQVLKKKIQILSNKIENINFVINNNIVTIPEVSITATGLRENIKDIPGSVSIIDNKQIQESGAQNIGQIITRVPGVNYLDEDGRGLKPNIGLRGLDPLRNRNLLVLIDGKFPVGMTYYGDPASYYMTPIQSIERIEVIKGASPVLYGGYSVGGVINMITPKSRSTTIRNINLSYGSFNAINAQISAKGSLGKLNYLASGLRRQGDGFRDRSKFQINDFTLNLSNQIDSSSELSVYLNGFSEVSQTPGGLTQEQYDKNPNQSQHSNDDFDSKRFSCAISYKKNVGTNHLFSTSFYGNYFERNWWISYKNPTGSGILRDIHTIGNISDYNYIGNIFGHKNSFIAGIRIHSDRLDNITVLTLNKTNRVGKTSANDINTSFIYETYLYDEFSITDNLTFAPGIRYSNIKYNRQNLINSRKDEFKTDALIYSGGLIYKFFGNYRIYATVSKGFQPPTLNAAINPANIDSNVILKPETSLNLELGLRTEPLPWISLSASIYSMRFNDKVISEKGINKNAGESFHRGIETELELGSWRGLSFFANGTLQKATFFGGVNDGKILPNAPQEMASLGLRYKIILNNQNIVFNLFNNYVGKQYSDSKNTEQGTIDGKNGSVPAYNIINSTINYSYKNLILYANVNNITDTKYFTMRWDSWNGIIPAMGRNFLVGAQIKF